MESTQTGSRLRDLGSNLAAGLRLAFGCPVSRDDFVYTLEQGLWLFSLLIAMEVFTTYLATGKPALFNDYGLNYLGAAYLLHLTMLLLISRLAGAGAADGGRLILASLAASPPLILATTLLDLIDVHSANDTYMAWLVWLLPMTWQFYILLRLIRIVLGTAPGKSFLLAVLQTAVALSSLWLLPYSELWYTSPSDEEGPYAELYRLSVEDLFYDQQRLVEESLAQMQPQRPGVADLYLLAVGGYGLERVFLNEVEYVRDLFDRRFDTLGHSTILVNNVSRVTQYPMANGHNLAAVLAGMAQRMDRDEDVLFLFMTSHGSRKHRFSLNFGPVPLDDLKPEQIRAALDDAGIRWRVIVVSSCYSGGFIEPLRDPNTLIITAAAADRTSFGCGAQSEFTDFGTAYFKQALAQQRDFIDAYDIAASWVKDKEQREHRQASRPQRFVGEAIRTKLAALVDSHAHPAAATAQATSSGVCGDRPAGEACVK